MGEGEEGRGRRSWEEEGGEDHHQHLVKGRERRGGRDRVKEEKEKEKKVVVWSGRARPFLRNQSSS